jgi:quinol monooxygenase YgiN
MRLREFSYRAVEMLIDTAPDADLIPGGGTKLFRFAAGLGPGSAASSFNPAGGRGETNHIEIYTRFFINPGSLAAFREAAAAMLQTTRENDPGTSRYDWFYDAAESECLALDTYDDAAAMFAHMANCHDAHERLLANATMVTEFLGGLPAAALAGLSKYEPYILPFFAGLKPYSQGGFG